MDLFAGHLPEVIIVLVVILIIWGPSKIPDVAAAAGRGIREFRKASAETRDAVRNATTPTPTPEEPPAPTPVQEAPAPTPVQEAPAGEHEPASPGGPSGSGAS
jgi:sec-independent protein translocase protein TatA